MCNLTSSYAEQTVTGVLAESSVCWGKTTQSLFLSSWLLVDTHSMTSWEGS